MKFTINHRDTHSDARTATLTTHHGEVQTPVFMPVGTRATVKAIHQRELIQDIDAAIILGNTYHLYLQPGMTTMAKAGGLHRFMHWERPILTDSGGYQVHSLSKSRKITEEGVRFTSYLDGSRHLFTPENTIDIQRVIGADIIMPLDECTPPSCDYHYAKRSMARTHRWLERARNHHQQQPFHYGYPQYLFPIVQGSTYRDLREEAATTIAALEGPGNAIGGVCHTEGKLYEVAGWVCAILPKEKPRYLMGVGTPQDLLESIARGIDMFDCVLPTRNGRNGYLFTTNGIVNIRNRRWKEDFTPIDPGLDNYASNYHSKGYLHHLFRVGERLAAQLATLHNLAFYHWLIGEARLHIAQSTYLSWKEKIIPRIMGRHP